MGMQNEKSSRPAGSLAAQRRARRQRDQRIALVIIGALVVILLAVVLISTNFFGLLNRSAGTTAAVGTSTPGPVASTPAAQRQNMYKALPPMQIDPNKSYRATIVTSKGNIVADLFAKDAPQHVNSFVFLSRQGFYDGLTFHRVEPGFVIQGGDPLGSGKGGPGYTIPPEIKRPHTEGALAMARVGGDPATTPSSGSQFYITLAPQPGLDNQYTVFGQVTSDTMPIVQQIQVGDVIKTIQIEEK